MNKQELQKEIENARAHLANMEKMLEQCEYERWKPKEGEAYWYIAIDGSVEQHTNVNHWVEKCHLKILNCFQTRKQAEAEAEKILVRRMLEDIARRLNKGKKIDWGSLSQSKYFIYLNNEDDELGYNDSGLYKFQGVVYCLDTWFLDVAIQEIGEERLKKYLRGE